MFNADYREIRQWLVEQIRAGQPAEALLRSMRDRGWNRDVAMGLIAQAMSIRASADAAAQAAAAPAAATPAALPRRAEMPRPIVSEGAMHVDLGDRKVTVMAAMDAPEVMQFDGFLSDAECDAVIDLAQPRMQRSLTVDIETGESRKDLVRTSRGMFFTRGETALVRTIEARVARLLAWPVERGEHLQVLHYRPGDRYEPHYDYFDPNGPGAGAVLARGGQRIATFLMYLREPERGGETTFPDLGMRFMPKRGSALFFSYEQPDPRTRTLHGGAPVIAGEKWVATKWLREGHFE